MKDLTRSPNECEVIPTADSHRALFDLRDKLGSVRSRRSLTPTIAALQRCLPSVTKIHRQGEPQGCCQVT